MILTSTVFVALSLPGFGEWAVILILVLVLFGGKNIPELAKALGKGIREFKRAVSAIGEDPDPKGPPPSDRSGPDERPSDPGR